MSTGIKQTLELVRAASAVLTQTLTAVADGDFSLGDKLKIVTLYPTIAEGLKGIADVPVEMQDLQPDEVAMLTEEIKLTLLKSGKFTHREADIAERILGLVYHNVTEIADILRLPPTAERA